MHFIPTNLPVENQYPKLIRDRIPEIVEKRTGKTPKIEKLKTDDEYLSYLLKKVIEEAVELQHSKEHGNIEEELADIMELIQSILILKGCSIEDIARVQKEKREKNGGFTERLIMLELPPT